MANKERVLNAIAVMENVIESDRKFNMTLWQDSEGTWNAPVYTKLEKATCGTVCCFAGWLALDPKFQEEGGSVNPLSGSPRFNGKSASEAVAEYLEIDVELAKLLTAAHNNISFTSTNYYGVNSFSEITPQMVIEKLKTLI